MGVIQFILDLLSGRLPQITNSIIALGLAVFAIVLGFFAINYLGRRRQMLHQERMAAMVKGLHYAGVAREVFARQKADSREHLLCGLRWLFGAAGISGTMYGYERLQPAGLGDTLTALRGALIGLIPAAIGIAHLLFSFLCSRRDRIVASTRTAYLRAGLRR
jgi:hypothetical protein